MLCCGGSWWWYGRRGRGWRREIGGESPWLDEELHRWWDQHRVRGTVRGGVDVDTGADHRVGCCCGGEAAAAVGSRPKEAIWYVVAMDVEE